MGGRKGSTVKRKRGSEDQLKMMVLYLKTIISGSEDFSIDANRSMKEARAIPPPLDVQIRTSYAR
jgi:hypothetical protein